MAVVFRFRSSDPRQRTIMKVETVADAVNHVMRVLNSRMRSRREYWTYDQEGRQFPLARELRDTLSRHGTVKLYDRGGAYTDDAVEICIM